MRYKYIAYDTKKYNFVRLINQLFPVTDSLENLHEVRDKEYLELFKVGADSCTVFHDRFYNKYHEGWEEMESLYEKFIAEVIAPLYDESFLYQVFPTFRVHLPDNVAVGAFHNDAEFHHPKGEMNYIIPLTNSNDTATIWIESEPGKEDFVPVGMIVGNLIQFNGNELTHGNKINETEKTRCSMDFRILPLSKYDENNSGQSMTLKTKFKDGDYYKKLIK